MSAFFFGSTASPLFGFHHAPRAQTVGAVLICAPWGREYQYSHRALRVLAKRLAERGLHVLRFDYSGTGDSAGDTTDGRLSVWLGDIECAADELRALSGRQEIHVVGLRLGALLGASAAAKGRGFGQVLLWDPIVSGEEWLASLNRPAPCQMQERTATLELDGQLTAQALADELQDVSVARAATDLAGSFSPQRRTLVIETQVATSVVQDAFVDVPNVELRLIGDSAAWLEDPSIWNGLVPVKAINTIVEWITR